MHDCIAIYRNPKFKLFNNIMEKPNYTTDYRMNEVRPFRANLTNEECTSAFCNIKLNKYPCIHELGVKFYWKSFAITEFNKFQENAKLTKILKWSYVFYYI